MFRKLTVIMCLITFCPVAVGAQELAGLAGSPAAVNNLSSGQPQPNLSLPAAGYPAEKQAVAENPLCSGSAYCSDASQAEESKNIKSSGLTMKEWAEIHLGDNRWIWWAGAAATLVALHVFVFVDHKN